MIFCTDTVVLLFSQWKTCSNESYPRRYFNFTDARSNGILAEGTELHIFIAGDLQKAIEVGH